MIYNMDKRVEKIHKLYNQGEYDKIIEYSLSVWDCSMDNLCRANISQHIASALYGKGEMAAFVDWQKKAVSLLPDSFWQNKLRLWGDAIFAMHHLSEVSDQELADSHKQTQQIVKDIPWIYTNKKKKALAEKRMLDFQHRKIRVAYISGDFINSVNITYVIQLLGAYDRSVFEVHCYALNDYEDGVTEQLKGLVDRWHDVHDMDAESIAKNIYGDEIDILVDVSLHAGKSRTLTVVAYKPAPIIVGGIGYMSTSGMDAVDYFLTDIYCDPDGMNDEHFTESLLRLPYTHFCYTPHEHSLKYHVNTDVHENITFGSLNTFYKLSDETLIAWRNILTKVPESRLILQSYTSPLIGEKLKERMKAMDFDMERIEIRAASSEYMSTYNDIDIALDSYPYTGGGTTFDALYMGVPVISRYGTRHGSRFGYSILNNLGLSDLAVDNWQDYENIAVDLARNTDVVEALHKGLRQMMQKSSLMNAGLYVKSVENVYKEIWKSFVRENALK